MTTIFFDDANAINFRRNRNMPFRIHHANCGWYASADTLEEAREHLAGEHLIRPQDYSIIEVRNGRRVAEYTARGFQ